MITGYVGLIGHGKTMLATREAVGLARRRGAILASNISVTASGVDFVRLSVGDEGLDGVPELLERARAEGRGVVILVDEIGIILPARFWSQGMSIDLMWSVSQSRKLSTDLIFTAQDIEQVDAFLRRLTQHVTKVRAVPSPSLDRRETGKRPWFFICSRWLPGSVDKPDKRLGRSFVRYRRQVEGWYDTDELVRPPKRLRGKTASSRSARAVSSSLERAVGPVPEPGAGREARAPEGAGAPA
jgi:hypothetical protein